MFFILNNYFFFNNIIFFFFFSQVKVYDAHAKNFPFTDILNKLKLTDGYPIINLIGAKDTGRAKFFAGIARAAFNADAVVVDSAIATGIEKYAIRRGIAKIIITKN